MKGISEEDFIKSCEEMHDAVINYLSQDEQNDNKKDDGFNFAEMSVSANAHDIIDSSEGFIITDNEEVENLFHEVFDISRGIVQYTYFINHNKADMKRAKNDKDFDRAVFSYMRYRKLLLQELKRAIITTEKVNNLGRKK